MKVSARHYPEASASPARVSKGIAKGGHRSVRRWAVLTGSSFLGLGYLPWMPGTWGTLGAVGVWWGLSRLAWGWYAALTACAILGAVWLSGQAERWYGIPDARAIVIDEVVGLLVTGLGVPFRWPQVLAAVGVFRLLDILKPPPIGWLDAHVKGGWGVVLDDVAAGLEGCVLIHGACWLWGGWW